MTASTYILAAVVAVLLFALVLCWMQPRRKAKLSGSTLTIDIECDSAQALAQIAEVTAAVERLDAAQRKAGLNLRVLDVPPVRLPAPAPEPKRRRKPRPQPKRETKPDTRKVERKGR